MKILTVAIRLIFSGILLYFVYGETGWATTLVLGLVLVSIELLTKIATITTGNVQSLVDGILGVSSKLR